MQCHSKCIATLNTHVYIYVFLHMNDNTKSDYNDRGYKFQNSISLDFWGRFTLILQTCLLFLRNSPDSWLISSLANHAAWGRIDATVRCWVVSRHGPGRVELFQMENTTCTSACWHLMHHVCFMLYRLEPMHHSSYRNFNYSPSL